MFKIYDGRDIFYQWDTDRKLIVNDETIKEVHFCNRTNEVSLTCETYKEDNLNLVNVPNILLTEIWRITVYAYDSNYTKHSERFGVISRSKPADYVYTETEVKRWDDLEGRIESLEKNGVGGGNAADVDLSNYYTIEETDTAISDAIGGITVINGKDGKDGYTPIKGVDYFDGADGKDGKNGIDGYTPVKGVDYFDGADGYTPIKGVDYFDGVDGADGKDGINGKDGKDGYTPIKGVDYFDGINGVDGKDGYTPVKGVDYFDGVDGKDGKDGVNGADGKDGTNGKDGYTPVKGVDYFDGADGKDGTNGKDGYTPIKDIDYFDGKDGEKGEKGDKGDTGLQGIQGEKGDKGDTGLQGIKGYSPIRGVDYWTEDDITAINNDIANEVAKRGQVTPEFVKTKEECTDTSKIYVLPTGEIYAYTTEWINQKHNAFDATTAQLNTRLNTSGQEKEYKGILLLPLVNVVLTNPYRVKITGVTLNVGYSTYLNVTYYSGSTRLGLFVHDNTNKFIKFADKDYEIELYREEFADADGVRLQLGIKTEVAITADDVKDTVVEFVPLSINDYVSSWNNTGLNFIPADYEDRILDLEEVVAEQAVDITALKDSDNSVILPDYWTDSVNTAINKVKTLQDEGGADVVNFVLFSDLHFFTGCEFTKNIGNLCAYVMDKCEIPLALLTGDTMTNDSVSNEGALLAYFDGANELLKPIGDRLLQIKGNHDDVYGSYTVNGNTSYYVNKVSANKVWNKMFRKQATNFNRVFGGNGYFYVDNIPQKTRFICLNGHYYDGEAITNGTTRAMSSGFGAEQLNWLASAALPVDKEGWSVVIATHCPPTAATINGVNYYLSQIPDGNDFRNVITAYCNKTGNFANKTVAEVAGIFCGHCHADAIVTGDLPCPIITVTTCNDFAYDGTSRTKNSDKETAMDIVSINKKTGYINLTRLGAGNDRTVKYKVVN